MMKSLRRHKKKIIFLFLGLLLFFGSPGCMRLLGRVVQPMKNDDVPCVYRPTARTGLVIWEAFNGRRYNFPNGTSFSTDHTPIWSRIAVFGLIFPLVTAVDTLLLPYDAYVALAFQANPPYWYCIREQDWNSFDQKILRRDLPIQKDFREAFADQEAYNSQNLSPDRFKQLYELAPSLASEMSFGFHGVRNMPFPVFEYLLARQSMMEKDILFVCIEPTTFDEDVDRKLEALLKYGLDPNSIDPFDQAKTVIDRLKEKQDSTSYSKEKKEFECRIELFRKYGGKSFQELIRQNNVSSDRLPPIPVRAYPERLDSRLRAIFNDLQQKLKKKSMIEFFLTYPGCVPSEIPALIVVQGKVLESVKIFNLMPNGKWSKSPDRNYFMSKDKWYLIITPKGVLLPEDPSALPTMVPGVRHIPLDNFELWFCGNEPWEEDMAWLLNCFPLKETDFSKTFPENGLYRYESSMTQSITPLNEKDPPFLSEYRKISENFQLNGSWKLYMANSSTPCQIGVFEYNTRNFGNLAGIETDGFKMIVYPPELFKNVALYLPFEKRRCGYWNEIGLENQHNLRIAISYGDNVSADTLQSLIQLAQELK